MKIEKISPAQETCLRKTKPVHDCLADRRMVFTVAFFWMLFVPRAAHAGNLTERQQNLVRWAGNNNIPYYIGKFSGRLRRVIINPGVGHEEALKSLPSVTNHSTNPGTSGASAMTMQTLLPVGLNKPGSRLGIVTARPDLLMQFDTQLHYLFQDDKGWHLKKNTIRQIKLLPKPSFHAALIDLDSEAAAGLQLRLMQAEDVQTETGNVGESLGKNIDSAKAWAFMPLENVLDKGKSRTLASYLQVEDYFYCLARVTPTYFQYVLEKFAPAEQVPAILIYGGPIPGFEQTPAGVGQLAPRQKANAFVR